MHGCSKAEGLLECAAACRQQNKTWIALARGAASVRLQQGELCDFKLRVPAAAGELFHCPAITVARREIHLLELRTLAQYRVDEAHAFEQICPIDSGYRAHAGDHIADRDVRCALPVMLV